MQTKLIKAETKVLTLETDLREIKADYDHKITNLESTIAAKDIHIKQLVFGLTFCQARTNQRMSPFLILPRFATLAILQICACMYFPVGK